MSTIMSELLAAYSYQRKTLMPARRSAMYFLKQMRTMKCAAAERNAKSDVTPAKGNRKRFWMPATGKPFAHTGSDVIICTVNFFALPDCEPMTTAICSGC